MSSGLVQLPKMTHQPLPHVDATPDADYVLRILRAHRQNASCQWVLDGDWSPGERRVYEIMNEHCEQRVKLLDEAIAVLEKKR